MPDDSSRTTSVSWRSMEQTPFAQRLVRVPFHIERLVGGSSPARFVGYPACGNQSGSVEIASSLSTSGREPELSTYCQAARLPAQPGSSGEYSGALALVNRPSSDGSKLQR